jgi:Fur family transcriptional regulator, zinc uptake regulator
MHHCDHPALDELLAQALKRSGVSKARFTEPRRQVMELLLHADAPLKAYELLDRLSTERGHKVDPPTIYRALEFLVDVGLAHRLDSLNAYRACLHLNAADAHVFLICIDCKRVEERPLAGIANALEGLAKQASFSSAVLHVELRGRCQTCV